MAASETALFALVRMESTRQKLAARVREALERMMARPLESLLVIIGLNEASNVFAECLATTFLLTWLGPIGAWLSVPLMLALVLIFADITPKTFALGFPAGVARVTAPPLAALSALLHPMVRWLSRRPHHHVRLLFRKRSSRHCCAREKCSVRSNRRSES